MSSAIVDDSRQIKETNPFESMMSRFDRAAQLLDLVDLIPRDVLALSLVAVPGQPDHGRDLGESARGVARQRQQLATFDP